MNQLPGEFRPVLRYQMHQGKAVNCEHLDEELWNQSGVVYARMCDGEVIYVGKCDKRLAGRLGAHLKGISEDMPKNPLTRYYKQWAEGKTITIFAYKPPAVRLCGHEVTTHRGLEAALIDVFEPRQYNRAWFVKRR
jgi:hypothetical protein